MIANPVLTLAWLALAHLVADFLIQSSRVATDKFGRGMPAWRALSVHGAGVALCMLPFVLAFGWPGLGLLVVVTAAHVVIDRLKVVLTRGAEATALAEAHTMREAPAPEASLGTAWTPTPAALFLLDQLIHAVVLVAAWAVFLAKAPVTDPFIAAVNAVAGTADPVTLQRVTLVAVVLLDVAIINVRTGALFVAILVHPRQQVTGDDEPIYAPEGTAAGAVSGARPVEGRDLAQALNAPSPTVADSAAPAPGAPALGTPAPAIPAPRSLASPARVGATIGVLERLLTVALVLTNAEAAIGLVVAAKTLARFKQLDDRLFAEYYLLGTLASISVALVSGLVAAAALAAP